MKNLKIQPDSYGIRQRKQISSYCTMQEKTMTLVLFIHCEARQQGKVFEKAIAGCLPEADRRIIRTITEFVAELKRNQGSYETTLFVLFADSRSRLEELISLRELLEDRRILLILPDESKFTLSRAFKLSPRFYTCISDSYDDLCEVINKMMLPGYGMA